MERGGRTCTTVNECIEQLLTEGKQFIAKNELRSAREILKKNSDFFAHKDEDVGRTNLTYHRIETGDAQPIKQWPRGIPFAKPQAVQELVQKMKERR